MTELIVIEPQSDAIDRAVNIIRTGHQQASEIPQAIIRSGALLALQVGANPNPLVGELYIYKIQGRWTPYLGAAYYRKIAEQTGARVMFAPERRGLTNEPRPMTAEERERYGVPADAKASICRGFRGDRLMELVGLGVQWSDAVEMLCRVGVGFLRDDEMRNSEGKYYNPPTGRNWQWRCDNRAEKDLYRKLGVVAQNVERLEISAQARSAFPISVDEGARYTLADANDDLGFSPPRVAATTNSEPTVEDDAPEEGEYEDAPTQAQPATNGRAAAQPAAPGPMPDDELTIHEAPAGDFVNIAAALLKVDADELKARLKALGNTGVPGDKGKRLAAYRQLKAAKPAPAAGTQDDTLFPLPVVDPA